MKEAFVGPLIALGALDLLLVCLLSRFVKFGPASQSAASQDSESNLSRTACILSLVAGIVGLTFRIYGFNGSLWLDEFGTLWTIEGTFSQLLERVNAFQGQSPLYYSLVSLFVKVLGESETTIRLLSLMLGICTVYGVYVLGSFLYGKTPGLISACLLWLTPSMVQSSSDARPYALALFMSVILFYGFARAARDGDHLGRCLFIVGGVGLFSAHYVLVLAATGIALGYLLFPRLRAKYPTRRFALDVGLQLLFVSWCLPHLIEFWSRRQSLSWLGSKNFLAFFEVIGCFIVLALAPYVARNRARESNFQQAMAWVFVLAIVAPIGCLGALSYYGANLLHPRYMIIIVIPAVLLASSALARLPGYLMPVPLAYWLLFIAGLLFIDFKVYGSFSRAGFQDWRKAVTCLDHLVRSEPNALILYRSGFVEEDEVVNHRTTPAVLSPLRSPGRQAVSWNLVPLTYSWGKPGRETYFAQAVEPAIRSASVFYFLSCSGCFNSFTGPYSDAVVDWVKEKFPGRFQSQFLQAGRGIILIRFVSRVSSAGLRSFENAILPSYPGNEKADVPMSSRQECG